MADLGAQILLPTIGLYEWAPLPVTSEALIPGSTSALFEILDGIDAVCQFTTVLPANFTIDGVSPETTPVYTYPTAADVAISPLNPATINLPPSSTPLITTTVIGTITVEGVSPSTTGGAVAATLTLVSITPHGLKYRYDYNGIGAFVATQTQAQMVAAFVAAGIGNSPLKVFLEDITTDGDWDAVEETSQVSIYVTIKSQSPNFEPVVAQFAAPPRVLQVVGVAGETTSAIVEIRFNHTIDR